ncbi:hypothetical protein AX16_006680 [Volvariella volvacea WC 439]|nr:hypothetical protein AX16_006680 [Volvariella volvacea WC 439]
MLVVGLTGGIATGKSTVSSLLQSSNDTNDNTKATSITTNTPTTPRIPLIDADLISRQVVEPGTRALNRIIAHFGPSILDPTTRTLDRKKLGQIIFNNPAERRVLNGIVHPAVRRVMVWEIVKLWVRGERVCVVDVPLLIESGLWKYVGMVVVVFCPEETQLSRLQARDSSSQSDAQSRLSSQLPISSKLPYADVIVDNSGSLQDLQPKVSKLIQLLHERAGKWFWRLSWLVPPVGVLSALGTMAWRWVRGHPSRQVVL